MARIFEGVVLGPGAIVDDTAVLGLPPAGAKPGEHPTVIGAGAVIRSHTVIYAGVQIGDDFQTGHGAVVREGNVLGNEVSVGTNATLEPRNRIGDRVRIHSGCILESAVVEDEVFLAPHVVLTDDPHPICPRYQDCVGGAKIRRQASIGANVTLLPGVEVGERALIGAGSVVATNIAAEVVAAGNPARELKRVADLVCWPGYFDRPYAWRDER